MQANPNHQTHSTASLADPVAHHMTTPVYSVTGDARLPEVRDRLLELGITSLAVVDPDRSCMLLGVVTRADLFRVGQSHRGFGVGGLVLPNYPVEVVMTPNPARIFHSASIKEAAQQMVEKHIHRLFVEDDTGVVGVLSARDIMRVIARSRIDIPLFEVMSYPVQVVQSKRSVRDAMDMMNTSDISGLVVVEQGWPCGVFTHEEALKAKFLPEGATVEEALNPAMLILPMDTPLYLAASNAASIDVRRVIASRGMQIAGIASGLDFCKVVV